jgi:hypothetical protein
MNSTNEPKKKRKVKDAFFQVSESFFEKEEILDLMSHYDYRGIGIYIKISLMLLKNQGKIKYDWSYFSSKKSDKIVIENIINNSGLFTLSADGTYFSSNIVDEQLEERGKISMDQTKRINKRWEGKHATTTESKTTEFLIDENVESNIKPKVNRLTPEQIDELNKLDGIKTKPKRKIVCDDDFELDA